MKKMITAAFLVLAAISLQAAEIQWITDYDLALDTAQKRDKNILVLITAPSWCSPCQYMEANTWPDPDVAAFVSNNFIALRVEDVLPNGSRNPLLEKFNFTGYPTTMFFSQKMEKFGELVGGVDPVGLMAQMVKYTDPDFDITSTFETLKTATGQLKQISVTEWEITEGSKKYVLPEVDRDGYAYLYSEAEDYYVAVPLDGVDFEIHITYDQGNTWTVWQEIQ